MYEQHEWNFSCSIYVHLEGGDLINKKQNYQILLTQTKKSNAFGTNLATLDNLFRHDFVFVMFLKWNIQIVLQNMWWFI